MKRKSIKIVQLIDFANDLLRNSHDDCVLEREGIMGLVSDVLIKTGNYKGYRYLTAEDMINSQGTTFGVQYNINGDPIMKDTSRIQYYK